MRLKKHLSCVSRPYLILTICNYQLAVTFRSDFIIFLSEIPNFSYDYNKKIDNRFINLFDLRIGNYKTTEMIIENSANIRVSRFDFKFN